MYYAGKVIDGVLHFRTTPDGEWLPMEPKQFTLRYIEKRTELADVIAAKDAELHLLSAQNEWLKARIANLQLPSKKSDHDTREKYLIECGMPTGDPDASV